MKNFLKSCLLGLGLLASPVAATTWNVTSDISMGTINGFAQHGDLVLVSNGTYTAMPNPVNAGTSYSDLITYRGGAGVTYSGSIQTQNDFIRVVGGHVTGNMHFQVTADNSLADSLTIDNLITMHGASGCKVSNSTVGKGYAIEGASNNSGYPNETISKYAHHDTLQNITGTLTVTSANSAGDKSVAVLSGFYCHSLLFDRVHLVGTVNLTPGRQDFQMNEYYWTRNSRWKNCYFEWTNNVGVANVGAADAKNVKFAWAGRDSFMFNVAEDCTLKTNDGTGPGGTQNMFANTGSLSNAHYNQYLRLYVFNADGPGITLSGGCKGLTIMGCVVVSTADVAINDNSDSWPDSGAVVRHNTLVSTQRRVVTLRDGTFTTSKFNQNLLYTTGALASSCVGESSVLMVITGAAGTATDIGDSNLVYPSATPTLTGSFLSRASGCYSWPYDATWKTGSPKFADSTLTFAGFNPTLLTGSFALNATWGSSPFADTYAGARGTVPVDITAPAAITDLAVTATADGSVSLTWTAPGDDGSSGTATTYDLRYSTSTITEANFAAATAATGEPSPSIHGTAETITVSSLTNGTPYFFAIKTSDEVPNTSTLSNVVSGTPAAAGDNIRPGPTTNLVATAHDTYVTLTWTSAGDDSITGTATSYDVRYRTGGAVTTGNFAAATQAANEPIPSVAGTGETMNIMGLTNGTAYNFALKTLDDQPNTSALSNSPAATPIDAIRPKAVSTLHVVSVGNTDATLAWTTVGDDSLTGTATTYTVYLIGVSGICPTSNTGVDADSEFDGGTPLVAGSTMTFSFGLGVLANDEPSTAVVVAVDEAGNRSPVSNCVTFTPTASATGITLGGIEVFPNYTTAGVRVWYTGDVDHDAAAQIWIKPNGGALVQGMVMDTVKAQNCFANSVIFLSEGNDYTLVVRVNDPDGETGPDSVQTTFTTRVTPTSSFSNTRIYVDYLNGSDSNTGTVPDPAELTPAAGPVKTLQYGWSLVPSNGALIVMPGAHYDSLVIADTGGLDSTLKKFVIGQPGAVIDGSDEDKLSMVWDSTSVGAVKVYWHTGFSEYMPRLVVADSLYHLFRHPTKKSLLNDSLGATVAAGWYKNGDTMFVQLEDGSNPTNHVMHFGKRTHLITVQADNIGIEGLNFRNGGSSFADDAWSNVGITQGILQIYSSAHVHVRRCNFYNNGWDAISVDSTSGNKGNRDILIERNSIWDTRVCLWGGTVTDNTIEHHPNIFYRSGRGLVFRNNSSNCSKDGAVRTDETTVGVTSDVDIIGNTVTNMLGNSFELDATAGVNVRVLTNFATINVGGNGMDNNCVQGPMIVAFNKFLQSGASGDGITTHSNNATAATDSNNVGRTYYYHNTIASTVANASSYGLNGVRKGDVWENNLLMGKAYVAIDDYGGATQRLYKNPNNFFDYNCYYIPGTTQFFHANNTFYALADTATFRTNTGWEAHGRFTTTLTFVDTTGNNWMPNNDGNMVDRGVIIPGINTAPPGGVVFYAGSAPDIGAVEYIAALVNPVTRHRRWLHWWPF